MFSEAPKEALEKWKSLGPVSIQELIDKSDIDMKELDNYEIKKDYTVYGCFYGMFRKGTKERNGICRGVSVHGHIHEAAFVNGKLNGFGRNFYPEGHYHVGVCKDHRKHGYGKLVLANG